MARAREPLLFLGVLAVTGLFTWLDLTGRYEDTRAPAARTPPAEALPRPAEVRLGAPEAGSGPTRPSSVFAPPRELLPLDPLDLADPPSPALPVRRPAVVPSLRGAAASAYRVSADELGRLALSPETSAGGEAGGDGASDAPRAEPAAGAAAGNASAGAAAAAKGGREIVAQALDESSLEARHDWIVKSDSKRRIYGTILNADPIGLASRPGEDVRFQQVSEATGGPLGAPFDVPRAEVVEFGLARTLENDYHVRSRQIGGGAAGVVGRRTLALEMLSLAAGEPAALAFALDEARLAQQAAPSDPATLRLLATVQAERKDLEGELSVHAEAERQGLLDPALLAAHARLARRLGLPARAEELLGRARTAGRPVAEVFVAEGLLAFDAGRYPDALAAFSKAEEVPFAGPLEDRRKLELVQLLGETRLALGDIDGARREAQRSLVEAPQDAGALVLQGAVESAAGELDAAAASFAAAMASDPDSARAVTDAGIVAWRRGDGDGARRLLRRAADLDPVRSVRPMLALGFVFEDAGEDEAARDLYSQALIVQPGEPEALYRLGRRRRLDGDPGGAIGTLREALRLAGPETLLLLELSRASREVARQDDALRYAREAERLEPGDAAVAWELGLAQLAAGDVRGCVAALERAVAAGARGAHAALGLAAYRRGEAQAALDHLDEVVKAYAGRDDEPLAAYALQTAAAIRDNLAKRQWVDRFGRSSLQRGWTEHAWDGSPRVLLEGPVVRIAGRMERPREDERPGITRGVDGRGFFGAQAEVALLEGTETRAGLSLTYSQAKGAQGRLPKARLSVWIDVDGEVRLTVLDNFDTLVQDGLPLGVTVAPGEPVLLGIERTDAVNGRFAFSIGGRRAGPEVEVKALRDFRNVLELAIWAEAAPGRNAGADVSLARIVQAP